MKERISRFAVWAGLFLAGLLMITVLSFSLALVGKRISEEMEILDYIAYAPLSIPFIAGFLMSLSYRSKRCCGICMTLALLQIMSVILPIVNSVSDYVWYEMLREVLSLILFGRLMFFTVAILSGILFWTTKKPVLSFGIAGALLLILFVYDQFIQQDFFSLLHMWMDYPEVTPEMALWIQVGKFLYIVLAAFVFLFPFLIARWKKAWFYPAPLPRLVRKAEYAENEEIVDFDRCSPELKDFCTAFFAELTAEKTENTLSLLDNFSEIEKELAADWLEQQLRNGMDAATPLCQRAMATLNAPRFEAYLIQSPEPTST